MHQIHPTNISILHELQLHHNNTTLWNDDVENILSTKTKASPHGLCRNTLRILGDRTALN